MHTIRQGTIKDFEKLNQDWAWGKSKWQRQGQRDYIKGIAAGTQEFWVIEDKDEILGELHLYWEKSNDPDEANGKNRAYLSAMRIHPNFRNQGLGTKLMEAALESIQRKGFTEATIGAYEHEPLIQDLYKKWGFTEFLKETWEETPEYKKKYFLYLKKL